MSLNNGNNQVYNVAQNQQSKNVLSQLPALLSRKLLEMSNCPTTPMVWR